MKRERKCQCADCVCPICRERPRDDDTRTDVQGRHWCMPCQDEHDDIDWDKVAEERMENYE